MMEILHKALDWIRYSGVWITVVVNPLHWRFSIDKNPYEHEWPAPDRYELHIQLLAISLRLVIDSGRW